MRNSYSVTKIIHFCYGHRLLNYKGKCRHPHGHNGKVEITLATPELDSLGMVMDFEAIKKSIQTWIDKELDHKMILHEKDPLIPALKQLKEPYYLIKENPTAEVIAKLIFDYAHNQKLPVTEVRLWETTHSFATYRS